jgi:histidine triad (HIT) family protein
LRHRWYTANWPNGAAASSPATNQYRQGENNLAYDDSNVFAKILRGEIPCRKVYEDDYALAFHDINPLMPIHVLVIPKGRYVNLDDFSGQASIEQMGGFMKAVGETARLVGADADGYRIVANNGANANQEVPHFHVHIFGGRPIRGRMVRSED